jgi:hypothetical protein
VIFALLIALEQILFVAQLVGVAQRRAEQALAQGLDRHHMLANGEHDAAECHPVLVLDRSRMTANAATAALPSGRCSRGG